MWLRIIEGPDEGRIIELEGERVVVGRDEECDITLDDAEASRHHAVFTPAQAEGCWILTDQGSTNGTRVNDTKIDRPVLIQGDEQIKIGDTVFFASMHDPKATVVRRAAPVAKPVVTAPTPEPLSTGKKALLGAGAVAAIALVLGIGYWVSQSNEENVKAARKAAVTIETEKTQVITNTVVLDPISGEEDPLAEMSEEEVDEAMADLNETFEWVLPDVDRFWARVYPEITGKPYSGPRMYEGGLANGLFDDPDATCGGQSVEDTYNAFMCYPDDTVMFGTDLMLRVSLLRGEPAVAYIAAHEFGHGIAGPSRMNVNFAVGINSELMADCLAGAWVQDAARRNAIRRREVDKIVPTLLDVADSIGGSYFDPGAHGTGTERTAAFILGFEGGVKACGRYGQSPYLDSQG